MSPTLTTFLFELVNFLVLATLLGWLLFKPVRARLQARQAADTQHADDLAARLAETDRKHAELRQREASFEDNMDKARSARLTAADEEAASILAKAREAADRERSRATRALGHLEPAELERLASAVAATSRVIVGRLLASLEAPELEAALLRAALRQVQALEVISLGAVLIESAAPLGASDRDVMTAALGTRATSLEFRVVPDLGAGVRVTTARGLVDVSAAGVAAEAERLLKLALLVDEPAATT